jgi:hypothetical protein
MASGNPNPRVGSPITNNNCAYNPTVYSDDEDVLSEHFEPVCLGVVCTPLSPDEDLRPVDLNARTTANCTVDSRLEEFRFILSTGATCHISSERSDFKTLTPILPHPVKDLAGGCAYAMGRRTIDFHSDISGGRKLTLQNVLFVPFARARLGLVRFGSVRFFKVFLRTENRTIGPVLRFW